MLFEQRKALAPLRILHAARLSTHAVAWPFGNDGLGADAAHQRELLVLGDDLLGVRGIDPGMGDNCVGHAVLGTYIRQQARFGDLLTAVALRLDMDGGHDIVQRRVAAVLRGQVGAAQSRVVTHVGMLRIGPLQPGIGDTALEIPKMMVGVDDRQVVVHVRGP
jgi:hypothetical protein